MSDHSLDRIAALEARLQQLEDVQEITSLLSAYGPLVDSGAADEVADIWTEDGVYDVGDFTMTGRQELHDMVTGSAHQGLITNGSAHFNGPPHVVVTGDTARAVCHSLLVLNHKGRFIVARAGAHLFSLARTEDGWKVTRRTNRQLNGDEFARLLLRSGVTGQNSPAGH